MRQVKLVSLQAQRAECPACQGREYPWLSGERGSHSAVLCGRNAVQLSVADSAISLDELEQKLRGLGRVTRNAFLLRFAIDDYQLTIFPDGRAIISGTEDIAAAKTIYARYIGA